MRHIVPHQGYMVVPTRRDDLFCVEKSDEHFYLSRKQAEKAKKKYEADFEVNYEVVPCIVMSNQLAQELLPDWNFREEN